MIKSSLVPLVSAAVPANTIALVGTNDEGTLAPSGWGSANFYGTLWNGYSGGAYVPGYGTKGAYVAASAGGHDLGYEWIDALIFDFTDYTWKIRNDSNGASIPATTGITASDTNGSPWDELLSGSLVPASAHRYKHMVGIGDSIYNVMSIFSHFDGNGSSNRTHKCQIGSSTCTWSRFSTNDYNTSFTSFATFGGIDYAGGIYDAGRNRIWFIPAMNDFVTTIPWLDLSTGSWSGTAITSATPTLPTSAHIYDPDLDCVFLLAQSLTKVYRLDLQAVSGSLPGWTEVTQSGVDTVPKNLFNRWAKYPVSDGGDGCFYCRYNEDTVRKLCKFDPSTRTFSEITIANGPDFPTHPGTWTPHYSRFIYVPALKCFAWIAGNGQQIALVRP